ncbi:DUF305 domain-containing protein [Nonomuraea basaltis]|uniref:DUF305 domain-containing protein n=1 Tax=Nonomuraea basaltis TaxID=2495887 RepID=UPI00110C70F6|nr:DUF305 domain-containing protein [Nonomuraea basaltis]TMR88589.1 DUF305 domain-containing protein [Nonomuraea basaltis]
MTTVHRVTMATVAGIGAITLLAGCGGSSGATTAGAAPAASASDSMDGMDMSPKPADSADGTTDQSASAPDDDNMDDMDMSSSKPAADFNNDDVMFVQMMLPHHQEGLQMAKWARTNASNAEVKNLAMKIQMEGQPQLDKLNGWLTAWDKQPLAADDPMMTSMDGMMSTAEMAEMKKMKGAMFDRMFVQMMISHHQGAIKVAKDEVAKGDNPKAKAMAKTIQTSLRTELTQMKQLLPTL